jgi:RimJ/RimL family protein N-acetyltransferase
MTSEQTVPRLTDGVVVLRAHQRSDAPGALEQCRDPESREWTTVPLDYTYRDALEFVEQTMPAGWRDDSEWAFAVEATDDDGVPRFAGTVSLRNHLVRRAEVAYGSHPWARGRGIMERALRLLIEWGFAERGLECVIWWANAGNWGSRKLAWRLGFRMEGSVRRWLAHRGELRDAWVGTLLSTDERRPRSPWLDVPVVQGERVTLRPFVLTDVARIVEGCTDPVTERWLGNLPQPYTSADAQKFLAERPEDLASATGVSWAMAEPGTGPLVGVMSLFEIRFGVDAELGYWVHPAARGRGVATEGARLALRHAFVQPEDGGLGLARVRALSAAGNTASRRVLEKAGMTEQGRERLAVRTRGGRLVDAAVYDILDDELPAGLSLPTS